MFKAKIEILCLIYYLILHNQILNLIRKIMKKKFSITRLIAIGALLATVSCTKEKIAEDTEQAQDLKRSTDAVSAINTTSSPEQIKGVKWKQDSDDNFVEATINWWLRKPDGTNKLNVLNAVASKANAIVIRVDEISRFKSPNDVNYDKAMNEIVDAISLAKNNNVNVEIYLWARLWLERDGNPQFGGMDGGALAVRDRFSLLFTKAISKGVLGNIKGIILVETNIDKMDDVKEYAKRIADKFNQNTAWNSANGDGFFKSRTFIMPGAGFGLDFRNVNNDNGLFFQRMNSRCKNFAFLYKFMKADHDTVTEGDYGNVNINGTLRSWEVDMEQNNTGFSVANRTAYLNYFGLEALRNYVRDNKTTYPNVTNVIFWGDKWDGISKIPPLSRQALHNVMVKYNPNPTGYFFAHAADNTALEATNKFYLFDQNLNLNQTIGWSGLTVAQEWDLWPNPNTVY